VDLPGRAGAAEDLSRIGLQDWVRTVLSALEPDRRWVLVGHSLGGVTVTAVATRVPERLARVVYVSCLIPADGDSALDAIAADFGGGRGDLLAADGGFHPMPAELYVPRFCNDLDAAATQDDLARLVPEPGPALSEPVWVRRIPPTLPRTYVRLHHDAAVTPDLQTKMIGRLGDPEVVGLDAGHMAMLSRPTELAALLNSLNPTAADDVPAADRKAARSGPDNTS
jgi:pimeloyl-ACP methyl ester carboxylesterase